MERYEKISLILKSPKTDKIKFLESLIDCTLTEGEVEESFEPVYSKAILYITCWVVLPRTQVSSLPQEFYSVYSLLDCDTSLLFPKFLEVFKKAYSGLPEIICNDTLLSICLTVPKYNEEFLEILKPEHCIGPLMWLLTYSHEHLKLASGFLPRAIMKKKGVKSLMDCFSKGDDTWKLKNLYVKILKSVPRNNSKLYIESVIQQVIEIISEYSCDKIVENIMELLANFYLQKFPEYVLPHIKNVCGLVNASQIVKFFRIFASYLPPNTLILFSLSENFSFLLQLWVHVQSTVLQIKNEIFTVFTQFFVYWEAAGFNFTEFLDKKELTYSFHENSKNEIEYLRKNPEPMPDEFISKALSLFESFSDISGASIIFPKIFSALLQRFNESSSQVFMYCISHLLSAVEPIFLVNMPENVEGLLKSCFEREDDQLSLISLQILLHTPDEKLSKEFLIKISPRVINLKQSRVSEIAVLASQLDLKISSIITDTKSAEIRKEKQSWHEDLDSAEPYLNAIGLHKLYLVMTEEIPWNLLENMLNKEMFVFGEAIRCYVKAVGLSPKEGIRQLIEIFEKGSVEKKQRVLEILFFFCKNGKNMEGIKGTLLEFIDQVVLGQDDENLINGALVVASQVVRRLKRAFFPYTPQCIQWILSVIRLSCSRIISSGDQVKTLAGSLILLKKLLKHCKCEDYLEEIKEKIDILAGLVKDENSLGVILKNVHFQIDEILMERLE